VPLVLVLQVPALAGSQHWHCQATSHLQPPADVQLLAGVSVLMVTPLQHLHHRTALWQVEMPSCWVLHMVPAAAGTVLLAGPAYNAYGSAYQQQVLHVHWHHVLWLPPQLHTPCSSVTVCASQQPLHSAVARQQVARRPAAIGCWHELPVWVVSGCQLDLQQFHCDMMWGIQGLQVRPHPPRHKHSPHPTARQRPVLEQTVHWHCLSHVRVKILFE